MANFLVNFCISLSIRLPVKSLIYLSNDVEDGFHAIAAVIHKALSATANSLVTHDVNRAMCGILKTTVKLPHLLVAYVVGDGDQAIVVVVLREVFGKLLALQPYLRRMIVYVYAYIRMYLCMYGWSKQRRVVTASTAQPTTYIPTYTHIYVYICI